MSVSILIFVLLYGAFVIVAPTQLSPFNFGSLTSLVAVLALAAMGTALTLIVGGFDLSVAGVISVTNVLAATLGGQSSGGVAGMTVLLVVIGLAIGLVNGVLIALVRLPSLGVTLGTYIVLSGVALVVLPAPGGTVDPAITTFVNGFVGYVPGTFILLLVFAGLWLVFTKTAMGRYAFAIGGDEEAARLSGIPTRRVTVLCYVIAGGLYACSGLVFSGVTATGSPSSGDSYLLAVFAAAALGLVSFQGGKGSAIAVIFGAASLTVIPKLLFALGVASFWSGALQGVVVLGALGIPILRHRLARPERRRTPRIGQSSEVLS